ncbi:MAG TPA: type II toxin-antitoxin system RelE/ParE family toxin [Bacteroidia bacterium]|jgi:mRNA interferase RelE/StbE|nr:type II toxin-antitoxin system RelE/ParE family toxin [Bacteroidia bacterium]
MAKYQIEFSKGAVKDYKKLPEQYKVLVNIALKKLSEGEPLDIKAIKGEKNTYRIRVGKFRVLYVKIERILLITKVADRKEAYR